VFTTTGTYSWSFVTQILHSGQRSHGRIFWRNIVGGRKGLDSSITV